MTALDALFAFDDEACERLAVEHGTPGFVYCGATAERQFAGLKAALPPRVRLAYAVKANPHAALLRRFAGLGASFDCASIGELERVAQLGLEPSQVLFAGPGKRDAELRWALERGVRIQAEGWEDLERLNHLAREGFGAPGEVRVNLRVHPASGVEEESSERSILGGVGPSAFGIDEEELPEILKRAAGLRRVRVRGLHVFAATNQRRASALLETYDMVFRLGRRLEQEHGLDLEQIDLGGGLGVPYAPDQAPLDVAELGRGLGQLLRDHDWFDGEVIVEPGRYLAASCGVYLARVVRIKLSRGVRFAILEGGINHLMRPLLTGEPFPVRAVRPVAGAVERSRFVLAGPLCTGLDRLGEVDLPSDLAAGDLLVFGMTGAYGRSEAMSFFLSHPLVPEVWIEGP